VRVAAGRVAATNRTGRPRQPHLCRSCSGSSLGRRSHVCLDGHGLLLHGLRRRRFLPDDRRVAGRPVAPHRPLPRCPRAGRRPLRARAPQRRRRPVLLNPLLRAPLRRRYRRLGRIEGRLLWQRSRRVHFWNHRRLHSATGYLPPAEYERAYFR